MNDLAQAIKDLILEYDRACKSDYVSFPIGYALYQTWKKYDLDYRKVEQLKERKFATDINVSDKILEVENK